MSPLNINSRMFKCMFVGLVTYLIASSIFCFVSFCIPVLKLVCFFQGEPSRGVLRKMCPENMQQIYSRTTMPRCGFNKVAKQSNFIEIKLRQGCLPVNLLHLFRKPLYKNTSGWLLLYFGFWRCQNKIKCIDRVSCLQKLWWKKLQLQLTRWSSYQFVA